MMDAEITRAVEDFVGAGYPRDADAVLLVELDGLADGVEAAGRRRSREVGRAPRRPHRAGRGRRGRARAAVEGPQVGVRRDRPHRARLLPARRGRARARSSSTCCARCTRSRASSSLTMMNVFHAGDGNLHPLIVVRRARARRLGARARRGRRDPRRVRRRRAACCRASTASGSRSATDAADLHARRPRRAGPAARRVRPVGPREPATRSCPRGSRCGELAAGPGGRVDLSVARARARRGTTAADAVPSSRPGRRGRRRRTRRRGHAVGRSAAPRPTASAVAAPAGIVALRPARPDRDGAARARRSASSTRSLGAAGQECPLDPRSTRRRPSAACSPPGSPGTGGSATGRCATTVLEVRFVTADGRLVKGGGPTVKNVTGYDLPRLLVGSLGTIGVLAQVTLRCRPRPAHAVLVPRPTPTRSTLRAATVPPVGDPVGRRDRPRCCSRAIPTTSTPRRARAGLDAADAAASPPWPAGPHRGRISVRPGRVARRRTARSTASTGCGGSPRSASARCTSPADDPGALGAARAVASRRRRLAAPRGGRARTSTGSASTLPERRAAWRASRTRSTRPASSRPAASPLPDSRQREARDAATA